MGKDIKETKEEILKALKGKQEIVINRCWGGFGLSRKALKRYAELKGFKLYFYKQTKYEHSDGKDEYERIDNSGKKVLISYSVKKDFGKSTNKLDNNSFFSDYDIKRDDEILVRVVKELGMEANGEHSELKIVEIPNNIDWEIDDYDGMETIREKHREWS